MLVRILQRHTARRTTSFAFNVEADVAGRIADKVAEDDDNPVDVTEILRWLQATYGTPPDGQEIEVQQQLLEKAVDSKNVSGEEHVSGKMKLWRELVSMGGAMSEAGLAWTIIATLPAKFWVYRAGMLLPGQSTPNLQELLTSLVSFELSLPKADKPHPVVFSSGGSDEAGAAVAAGAAKVVVAGAAGETGAGAAGGTASAGAARAAVAHATTCDGQYHLVANCPELERMRAEPSAGRDADNTANLAVTMVMYLGQSPSGRRNGATVHSHVKRNVPAKPDVSTVNTPAERCLQRRSRVLLDSAAS
jgi:hypothetical protein